MAKPRIPPAESPGPEATETLTKVPTLDGRPLNIFTTLAHHPLLLKRFIALGGVFTTLNQLPARERELVILRTAWRTGSAYEFGQHTRIGLASGLSEDEIGRVARDGAEGWEPADGALLNAVDELQAADRVGDDTWAELSGRYTEAELLELLALIGFYRMTAGILNSAGVESEAGVMGWPPGTEPR
ncbi:MAG: carboxymuconolactone decarboxylase family protein [Candidatus Dormibacteraeota bacterium]|nr:carboxymuconolactone decarboxylase family protein [Candidatus Dormibacteraeota bacterium]